ncbi:MAG: Flp pilus assembly protein CpaB [Acetivibrionales bacterium]|jgi:Flp pilus assembly protein CpaB
MRRFGWIAAASAIVVLLVALEIVIVANAAGYEKKEKVVFAKERIDKNTVITGEMLEVKEIGSGSVHPKAVRAKDEAVSMRAAAFIEPGEMLLQTRLSPVVYDIIEAEDKNKRLFSAELDADQANAWQLAEGRHVDIVYIPNSGNEQEKPPEAEGVSHVLPASSGIRLLKNIRIAGIIGEDGKPLDMSESDRRPRYVSFEVTEEQAIFLAYAKYKGKIVLFGIP